MTAGTIILIDKNILDKIVYVPVPVWAEVGFNSSTINPSFADYGLTIADFDAPSLSSTDYSYLSSDVISFIESCFKDENAFGTFGFLLIPFDGIDLRVEEGETLPVDPEVEIVLNWDITNCLELDGDGGTPHFAKRVSAGGDLPFDFSVDVIVR